MPTHRGRDDAAALDAATLPEESLEDLYEHAPAGYLSTLPGGLVVKVNETLLSWTGHRRDDLVGRKRLHDLLAPGARIYYETHYAPLLQMQGNVREIAVELIRADGSRLPVLLNSTLVRDEAGSPRVVRTTVVDASERRRYEHELQHARSDAESRARAALALEHVNDGVLLVTTEGLLAAINPAAERIFDVRAGDALGRPVADVVAGWAAVASHAPTGDAGARTTPAVIPLTSGGHDLWLAAAGVDAGEGGVVYTFRDVTADHALEELRGEVVAVVSHELRTPLTGVYGSAQTLLARYDDLDDSTRRQLLEMVVEQADRLAEIVDRILLADSLDRGEAEPRADASEVAGTLEAILSALPFGQRDRVSVEGTGDAVVAADAASLRQILSSLLDNALKYSEGRVVVGVEHARGTVRFTVGDNGPGVPPAEHAKIFDRFYRLDPDQRRGVSGIGLGLYIARQLTQRLGGTIGVLPGGSGATIFVDLPSAGSPSTATA
jgi:PAS domain S-box-containing protein